MTRVFLFAIYRLRWHCIYTQHNTGDDMTDKALDLLEFIAGAAISAGFIFLSAYALVGGI